jgi:hypothetical protein
MPLRMLDYMTRQAKSDRTLHQHSAVFYVGEGAGADDTGKHRIDGPDGQPRLEWQYQVVHLWKLKAAELFAFNRLGLLVLVGQTQIDNPPEILPRVIQELKSVPDDAMRQRLLADLVALISDQEIINMVEKLIEEEGLLMDTPFLRRLREQSRQEGELLSQRRAILNVIVWRFNPPVLAYQQVEKTLAGITNEDVLEIVLKTAAQAQTFEEFQTSLNHILAQSHGDQTVTAQS